MRAHPILFHDFFSYLHSIEYSKGHCFFLLIFTQIHTNFLHERRSIYYSMILFHLIYDLMKSRIVNLSFFFLMIDESNKLTSIWSKSKDFVFDEFYHNIDPLMLKDTDQVNIETDINKIERNLDQILLYMCVKSSASVLNLSMRDITC